ncbi:hypothetical protein BpHYR1_023052 [Brachionus plicatilis]|uniref:Uncharacterized protein n=1 Tax=Brachionus plicatilis TaxID=10195 RepID=A0A3M7P8U5_BRAPC|nr:hypothetical protein BpHYR1_023052 [Brachionus plicatilis]
MDTLACAESNKRNSSFKNEGDIGSNSELKSNNRKLIKYVQQALLHYIAEVDSRTAIIYSLTENQSY